MANLRDALVYICEHYPHCGELSRARLTKMVYLADWKFAIDHGRQMTDTKWYFDNYGPYVWDIWKTAESNPDVFDVQTTQNMYGDEKNLIKLRSVPKDLSLTEDDVNTLNHVIETTRDLNWSKFINLVYSTYPVRSTERYYFLDLVSKAQEYKAQAAAIEKGSQ